MQARYGNRDENEERKNREEQMKRDEEIARKLANDHPQNVPGYGNQYPGYQNHPQYYQSQHPPGYNQNVYAAENTGYNQSGYYQQPYPSPPNNYYASEYYPAHNPRPNESQPLVQSEGFLPEVKDTCCYINTQICVLTLAVLMIVGIITGVVIIAVS
jgi:hypothetical protein